MLRSRRRTGAIGSALNHGQEDLLFVCSGVRNVLSAMPVALYLRVSSEEQRERRSIATQREFGLSYCSLHQLVLAQTYADDGVSGTVPLQSRPLGKQLLEDAQQHKFDQLLVFKLDRIGRDARLILNAVAELEQHGVGVISMTEAFDTSTATGRLMLTLLSGFAAHERELIRERSLAGTHRLAQTGTWLGGVVPYGYRKHGDRSAARLEINQEPIPALTLTEADIIRTIFSLCAVEKHSCQRIADHLNALGIPCGSTPLSNPGSEHEARPRAALWRPSQVRNLIISRTYMGQHVFGKRSQTPNRAAIVRPVPAIISEATWDRAQQVLHFNRYARRHNDSEPFLLRGRIECGLCGLMYSGLRMAKPQPDHYYRCNGRQFAHKLYGRTGRRCGSPSLHGDTVERLVTADIQSFLHQPEKILEHLHLQLCQEERTSQVRRQELDGWMAELEQKTTERDRVLALFRRGRIEEGTLDEQLDAIESESVELRAAIKAATRVLSAPDQATRLQAAEALLSTLRESTDPLAPALPGRLIDLLVDSIRVGVIEDGRAKRTQIVVRYRFTPPDDLAPLIWQCTHAVDRRNPAPAQLHTLGDHLRQRRLTLQLPQRQVAQQLGVTRTSLFCWEHNRQKPSLKYVPAILQFLGYHPKPQEASWAARLLDGRARWGLTRIEAALRMGVDPSTLARWERGEREPAGKFATRAKCFLDA